ncbi:high mobility group protein B1, partial [Sigmodon hispidus]
GDQKEVQGPQCAQEASFSLLLILFGVSPKNQRRTPWLIHVAKKLGEMWINTAADDKQPYEKKAAKLKEKYEKDIAAYRAKGKPNTAKKGVVKAEESKKKKEEEDDEEDEEDEEEEEEEEDEEEDDDDDDE